jgi:RimJ/RimL family protein N-acetyltransferase
MTVVVSEVLDTERLRAERLAPEHEPELARTGLDPRVSRTLWPWADGPTPADIHDGLERQLAHWDRHGFGLWLLRDRRDAALVGRGGLQYTDAPGEEGVEAAWAITLPDNVASRRVMTASATSRAAAGRSRA